MTILTLREISRLQSDLRQTKMLLRMANDTIEVLRHTSERDWATICRLVGRRK